MKLTILTPQQSDLKKSLESEIKSGIDSFVKVGNALLQIQAEKLFSDEFESFEDYCKTRWGFSRFRGYQLIRAAEVAQDIEQIVNIPTEAAAREISKLPTKRERKIAAVKIAKLTKDKKATKQKRVATAKEVKEIVAKIQTKARGGLAAMKAQSEMTPTKPKPEPTKIFEPSPIQSNGESPAAKIEAHYQANKAWLNTLPLPTYRAVYDRIIAMFQS